MSACPWVGRGAAIVVVVVLAGCVAGDDPRTANANGPSTSESGSVAPNSEPPGTSPDRRPLELGQPGPVMTGVVTVTVSGEPILAGEAIKAVIANGLDIPLYTEDQRSDCSVVTLEQQVNAMSEPILGCEVGMLPTVFVLGPGVVAEAMIDPLSGHFGPDRTGPAFGAGQYRLRFDYRDAPTPVGDTPLSVVSEPFEIVG